MELTITTQIIEYPYQLESLETGDKISTKRLIDTIWGSEIDAEMLDEIVISNENNKIVTITKNQGDIFERSYQLLEGKLLNFDFKKINRFNPKYFSYQKRLREANIKKKKI